MINVNESCEMQRRTVFVVSVVSARRCLTGFSHPYHLSYTTKKSQRRIFTKQINKSINVFAHGDTVLHDVIQNQIPSVLYFIFTPS